MSDQADRLRQLVRETVQENPALQPGIPIVVVSGGKGGVGTSTVALEFVKQMAQLHQRTVLVDANPYQPDLATQAGIEVTGNLAEVLDGTRSVVEVLQPLGPSIRLLPGRWAAENPPVLNLAAVNRLLHDLRGLHAQADLIVLDAGSGASPWVERLWKAAHQVLLVTSPEPVAVMDSYAAIKLAPWGDIDGKVRLVVNQCDDLEFAQNVGHRFSATCRRFLGIHVEEPAAVASRGTESRNTERFKKSVRTLAADVISSVRVVTATTRAGSADSAPRMSAPTVNPTPDNTITTWP